MVIKPRVRGFICVTTHPTGCDAAVKQQIDYIQARPKIANGPKRVPSATASRSASATWSTPSSLDAQRRP